MLVPGLPRYNLPMAEKRVVSLRAANLAATMTNLAQPQPFAEVDGAPSMQVRMARGGVETMLRRTSRYTDNLSGQEIEGLKTLLLKAVREAERASHGSMSYAETRRRLHPFGQGATAPDGGRRRGIGRGNIPRGMPNRAVVNLHSGQFAGAWSGDVTAGKSGVNFSLKNSAPYAPYLALGTKYMIAHGPFTAALVKYLPDINREWLRLTRLGYAREVSMQAVAMQAVNSNR